MSQYEALIDLARLDGTDGFRLDGWQGRQESGRAIASAGDINGDGFADLIIGTHGADDYAGRTVVIYGKADGFDRAYALNKIKGADGLALFGADSHELSGLAVSTAGDLNGDGLDDFVIGAPGGSADSYHGGQAYVVYGDTDGLPKTLHLADLDGENGFRIRSDLDYQGLGQAVAGGTDVNGDGIDDLILGTSPDYGVRTIYVVYGDADGFDADFEVHAMTRSQGLIITGAASGDGAGFRLASAGDVNGDGVADMVIGAFEASPDGHFSGAAYVVFGSDDGFPASISLADLDGANGFELDGAEVNAFAGRSVASADVNGDGFADVVVSGQDIRYSVSGEVYVVFGSPAPFAADMSLADLNGLNGFKIINSTGGGDHFGYSAASAGDVNGDGFEDLIIGAPDAAKGGAAYVLFGKADGFGAVVDVSALDGSNGFKLTAGEVRGGWLGFSVASAGDLNGDGLSDLAIGAPASSTHGQGSGDAFVLFGVLPDQAVDRLGTSASQNLVGGDFKDRLSGVGGDDQLYGNGGSDRLLGGTGDDTLRGGDGADVLVGGRGQDLLVGGAGKNHFLFMSVAESSDIAFDTIADLHKGDVIDLSRIDADASQAGDQAFMRVATFTGHAGELVVSFDTAAVVTSFAGDVDGDGQADLLIQAAGLHDHFAGLVL